VGWRIIVLAQVGAEVAVFAAPPGAGAQRGMLHVHLQRRVDGEMGVEVFLKADGTRNEVFFIGSETVGQAEGDILAALPAGDQRQQCEEQESGLHRGTRPSGRAT
jgi:hypothetical protein